jgi:hypothetical protein
MARLDGIGHPPRRLGDDFQAAGHCIDRSQVAFELILFQIADEACHQLDVVLDVAKGEIGRVMSRRNCRPEKRGPGLRWGPSTVRAFAGYLPEPQFWARARKPAPRENLHVVGALGVLDEIEAFALDFDRGTQADDHVDDLVEDRRADA